MVKKLLELNEINPNQVSLFGPEPGSFDYCGREVPVLIVLERGDIEQNQIYPKMNESNQITTIMNYLKSVSDEFDWD